MRDELNQLHEDISSHLTDIEKLFKPGHKLTLFCRNPNKPNQECMLTGEDPDGDKREQFTAIVGFASKLFCQSDPVHRIQQLEQTLREAHALLNSHEITFRLPAVPWRARRDAWNKAVEKVKSGQ